MPATAILLGYLRDIHLGRVERNGEPPPVMAVGDKDVVAVGHRAAFRPEDFAAHPARVHGLAMIAAKLRVPRDGCPKAGVGLGVIAKDGAALGEHLLEERLAPCLR